jgi:NMD protein affecting ribosome stability and mRNA decay
VQFLGELCEECVTKKLTERIALPDVLKIRLCRVCGKLVMNTIGESENLNRGSLERFIHSEYKAKLRDYKIRVMRFGGGSAHLELVGEYDGYPVRMEKDIELKESTPMCRHCSLKAGGYYEALIQLRGDPKRVGHMADNITAFAERYSAFVSKREEMKFGIDLYVSNKEVAGAYFSTRKLKPTKSYTLYGMRSGKKVYRNIYSLRL